jgi:hypothetical protein
MHVHPDIIERLQTIAAALASASLGVFCGRPIVFDPITGKIVAFGFGMSYVVRLPASVAKDARTFRRMSNGAVVDLQRSLGEGWVFGDWSQNEIDGC